MDVRGPVVGRREAFDARLGYAARLEFGQRNLRNGFQIRHENRIVDTLIAVHAYEIDPFVARPAEVEVIDGLRAVHLRGDGVDEIMHALRVAQILHREFPQVDELFGRRARRAPPGPGLRMFVERAENHGNQLAVAAPQVVCDVGQAVEPLLEFPIRGAALRQNLCGHPIAGVVPRIAAGKRIVDVNARREHHAAVVSLPAAAQPQRLGIRVRSVAIVDMLRKIETVYGGIVAADGLRVGTAFGAVPRAAVHQVIVVTEHEPLALDGPEVRIERFGLFGGIRVRQREGHGIALPLLFRPFAVIAARHAGKQQRQ